MNKQNYKKSQRIYQQRKCAYKISSQMTDSSFTRFSIRTFTLVSTVIMRLESLKGYTSFIILNVYEYADKSQLSNFTAL